MVKERAGFIWSTLPFNKVPGRIVVVIILFVFMWLNDFPTVDGISQTYFPRTIMPDYTLEYFKHCRVQFGTYAETHEDSIPTKTTAESSQVSIYLGTTKNLQEICKFIRPRAGQRITGKKLTPLPMPKYEINQVEDMAIKEDCDEDLIFTDRNERTLEVYNKYVNIHKFISITTIIIIIVTE